MEILVIVAGILMGLRSYWVYNLLREEKGLSKGSLLMFIEDKNKYTMYLIIRPFLKEMKNERLKSRINIITYIIYACFFIVGMILILK